MPKGVCSQGAHRRLHDGLNIMLRYTDLCPALVSITAKGHNMT